MDIPNNICSWDLAGPYLGKPGSPAGCWLGLSRAITGSRPGAGRAEGHTRRDNKIFHANENVEYLKNGNRNMIPISRQFNAATIKNMFDSSKRKVR
jgi:hypothetical protein